MIITLTCQEDGMIREKIIIGYEPSNIYGFSCVSPKHITISWSKQGYTILK